MAWLILFRLHLSKGNSDPEGDGSSGGSQEKLLSSEGPVPSVDSPRDSGCYESNENLENGNDSLPHPWLSGSSLLHLCDPLFLHLCMRQNLSDMPSGAGRLLSALSVLRFLFSHLLSVCHHQISIQRSGASLTRLCRDTALSFTSFPLKTDSVAFAWQMSDSLKDGFVLINSIYCYSVKFWSHSCVW